jgi:PAS domain S-box-containing protein
MPGDDVPTVLSLDLIHRLPLGILIFDRDGSLVSANQAAERLLGPVLDQGATMAVIVERLGLGCSGLTGLEPGQKVVVLAGGLLLEVEAQRMDSDARLWLIDDKSEELRLRSQLAEQASLLAHGNEAFLVVDQQGLIRYANAIFERDMRTQPGALVGQALLELQRGTSETYDATQDVATDVLRERMAGVFKAGGPLRYNAWQRRADGTEYPVEVSMRPYRMSQEPVLLTTVRDESRRLQHVQDLMAAKAMAEAANRSKSAFLAITSHELRTPLTSIIGFCDLLLLEHGGKPGDLSHSLRLISESSRSLLRIINDILDLSKIEAKTLEIRVEPVDPDRVLDLLAELWQQRASAKQLRLVRQPSVGKPRPFYSDPLRLRQVLDNLLNNAVKFTQRGSIEIGLEHNDEDLVFTVTDSGSGVPETEQHQLFQPFWQMADATTRREGGTGLGLYICRQIAMLLGGTIWLARSDGSGTSFKIRLPRNIEGQTGLHRAFSTSVFKTPPPR